MNVNIFSKLINEYIKPIVNKLGIEIKKYNRYPHDFTETDIKIWDTVKPFTMTTAESVRVLIDAVKYVVENNVEGDLVECGVWKGGSAMTIALALKEMGKEDREIYLYDTFAGMSAPTDKDISKFWGKASDIFLTTRTSKDASNWCLCSLDEVKNNFKKTSYSIARIHYIQGKLEDTIPKTMPKKIALLRLDTDWYKSTKHELVHLFPKLSKNGILILDDYEDWEGAKKAVDEYIKENNLCLFLSRIDESARIALKI